MTAAFLKTSGNLQADRRYQYALDMAQTGDFTGALDILSQTLDLAPAWPVLPFTIAEMHMKMEQPETALDWYARSIALDQQDHQGAALKIQILGGGGEGMPRAFVETLFDQYAPRFETHLTEKLHYDVPRALHALQQQHKPGFIPARILDLGCGTGLAAQKYAGTAQWIEGVDLSAGMLAEAEKKKIYNRLAQDDLQHYLDKNHDSFDLILAADVLIYLGDLAPVFSAVKKRLARGGVFLFSVQKQGNENVNFHLDSSHRFSYSHGYITRALTESGMAVLAYQDHILRQDQGRDVAGALYMCG